MAGLEYVKKLGDGSAVEAWLGRVEHQHFVLQLARPALTSNPELFGRALYAARYALKHPELVTTSSTVRAPDGRLMVVSEPVSGWTGADLLRVHGRLPHARVVEWAVSVCEALELIHARGSTHGCLAPRHLHVQGSSDAPTVKLFDTSLLHLRGASSSLPSSGTVVEPEYLSPERASGSRGTIASDVWGVGVLIVELLQGRPPWRGKNADETRAMLKSARPPTPGSAGAWKHVLLGCLDPSPVNRFASALELRQAVAALA